MKASRPEPVAYMWQVARTPAAVAYKRHILAEMQLEAGLALVDVGCGPGTDLQDAADLAPAGLVVGLDFDQRMLAAARSTGRAALIAGDAHQLPFAARSIDRLRTDRAFQHVRNPRLVLQEFHRVLRPGGVAVLAEPDWRSLIIDGGRRDIASRFVDYTCERVVRNATVGSEVGRLGQNAGFVVGNVAAFPAVFRDFAQADKVFGLSRNAVAGAEAGYLTTDDAEEWVAELAQGPVLVAVTLFVTTLVKRARSSVK